MSIVTKAEAATGAWWAAVPVWAYASLALLALSVIQTWRLGDAKRDEVTLKASVATFESTQKTNLATIADLQKANADWLNKFSGEVANSKIYLDAANQYAQIETDKATKAQKSLDAIYAKSPSAKAWAASPVDLSVSSQLRANSGSH